MGFISMSDAMAAGSKENIAKQYEERCREIVDQIKRHVDDVRSVEIESDHEAICSHCGSEWSEEDDAYNGGCCERDEEDEKIRTGEQA
ncbi:hypothetical protein TP46_12350 [Xanthomonas citri pv. aurantifolii]|nr:hypothetical protein TP49_11855 [Xanthomonas citri pv. aurantifolii]TBX03217.1 hypothetical protein TP46_12350 [Xanthomonas citri pv. aurantifolii]